MSAKDELGALTIRNCRVVAQSYWLLKEIDRRFLRFFNAAMPRILREELPGWEYWNFLGTNDSMSFWPASWHYPNEKYAYFQLTILQDNLWMNCLTGEDGELCFAFLINPELFGDRKDKAQMLKQKFYVENETELLKHGFHQKVGKYWFNEEFNIIHPFKLDVDTVASEYPNWSDKVLQPFRKILEDIKDCFPIFDGFVRKIAGPN